MVITCTSMHTVTCKHHPPITHTHTHTCTTAAAAAPPTTQASQSPMWASEYRVLGGRPYCTRKRIGTPCICSPTPTHQITSHHHRQDCLAPPDRLRTPCRPAGARAGYAPNPSYSRNRPPATRPSPNTVPPPLRAPPVPPDRPRPAAERCAPLRRCGGGRPGDRKLTRRRSPPPLYRTPLIAVIRTCSTPPPLATPTATGRTCVAKR